MPDRALDVMLAARSQWCALRELASSRNRCRQGARVVITEIDRSMRCKRRWKVTSTRSKTRSPGEFISATVTRCDQTRNMNMKDQAIARHRHFDNEIQVDASTQPRVKKTTSTQVTIYIPDGTKYSSCEAGLYLGHGHPSFVM